MECWPRNVDLSKPGAQQYPGWPRTIDQLDNYSPRSWGQLGTLTFNKKDPVVQLVDESNGEVLYTLRIRGNSFTPHAPGGRTFSIKAGVDHPGKVIVQHASVGKTSPADIKLP